ncbi:hypothetical protein RDWZM_000132 [Blomia tropicalis]|uniref:Neurotransmitter-gated ion-channel ligand-binding domain-containing protein n=1 Tax=Blomia tropicalis TaxID=40697 RepID=A0A9Q0M9J4_BLOTA|nr:hypothetical protein RDWZM_000132 [Blomia tropicalis]
MLLCLRWTDYRLVNPNPIFYYNEPMNMTERLNYDRLVLTKYDSLIWLPLITFPNGNEVTPIHSLRNINFLDIWVPAREVRWCRRISAELNCPMALSSLPFDQQFCYIELQPGTIMLYSIFIQNLILFNSIVTRPDQHIRIQMESIHSLLGGSFFFQLSDTYFDRCQTLEDGYLQSKHCVAGVMRLIRHLNYYIIRYYCPTFLSVAMTMLEFWIPVNAWPCRIILAATILFTFAETSITAYNSTPARDVVSLFWWLWGLQTIIYLGLCGQAFSLAWHHFVTDRKRTNANNLPPIDGHYFGHNSWWKRGGQFLDRIITFVFGPTDHWRDPVNRNKYDYVARLVYPTGLMIFVLVYVVTTIPRWRDKYRND